MTTMSNPQSAAADREWARQTGHVCALYFRTSLPAFMSVHGEHPSLQAWQAIQAIMDAFREQDPARAAALGMCDDDPDRIAGRLLSYCWTKLQGEVPPAG